jgi:hypothetical protein
MSTERKKRRPVTGFRLDPDVLAAFHARLRAGGMAMQPTVEGWVKRWLDGGATHPDHVLTEIRAGQNDIRNLLIAVAGKDQVAEHR